MVAIDCGIIATRLEQQRSLTGQMPEDAYHVAEGYSVPYVRDRVGVSLSELRKKPITPNYNYKLIIE